MSVVIVVLVLCHRSVWFLFENVLRCFLYALSADSHSARSAGWERDASPARVTTNVKIKLALFRAGVDVIVRLLLFFLIVTDAELFCEGCVYIAIFLLPFYCFLWFKVESRFPESSFFIML